jgi:hypothetical protein
MSRLRRAWGLVAILLCPALVMAFQGQLMLTGVVEDDTGAAVPGATVTVTGPTNAEPYSTTSQQDGNFTFDNLLPASYVLKIELDGFETYQKGLTLSPAEVESLRIRLVNK